MWGRHYKATMKKQQQLKDGESVSTGLWIWLWVLSVSARMWIWLWVLSVSAGIWIWLWVLSVWLLKDAPWVEDSRVKKKLKLEDFALKWLVDSVFNI